MAVGFDAVGTFFEVNATANTIDNTSLTVGVGTNRALLVWACFNLSEATTTMVWDPGGANQSLTLIADQVQSSGAPHTALYGLVNPVSGNKILRVTWTTSTDITCFCSASFTGVDQTGGTTSFVATTATGNSITPAVTVPSAVGNMVAASFITNASTFSSVNNTQVYIENGLPAISCAGNRASGAASVVMNAPMGVSGLWAAVGANIVAAGSSTPATAGGTATDAGTTFQRKLFYQSFAQPVVFTVAAPPYAGWDDTLEWPRSAQPRSSAYSAPFTAQLLGVFQDRDSLGWFTDFTDPVRTRTAQQQSFLSEVLGAFQQRDNLGWFTPLADPIRKVNTPFQPWAFIQSPAQVFFPYTPWDDFTRRKPQPLDTQPLAWPPTPVATPFPAMGWISWPDFAPRQKPAASFTPWTFIPTPAQVFFPYAPWDDFTRRKPQYPDTQPQAWTGQNIAAPAPVMAWVRWPDFAPKKPLAADLWPLAFVPLVPSATVIGDWPDFVRRKPQPLDTQPLIWAAQTIAVQQVWFPYDPWPSLIAKKPVPLNYIPATPFIQTPAQVWFPHDTWPDRVPGARRVAEFRPFDFVAIPPITTEVRDWPDFAWRKSQPLDTQPLIWSGFTPAATVFFIPNNWPDFAPKARPLVDVRPWSFIQSPAQVFFPYGPWDDFTRRKPSALIYPPAVLVPIHIPPLGYIQWPDFATKKRPPLNYEPLTYLQLVRTPWNEMSRWPDMVPIRTKAGLNAALQQFSARFPGTITQATITGILNAFEVNSDVASITILVRQSQPAARAEVSIQEIGTI